MWVSFGFNTPYASESLSMLPFQYPMWVSFGFNYWPNSDVPTMYTVSVPYVGELRIQ